MTSCLHSRKLKAALGSAMGLHGLEFTGEHEGLAASLH